MTHEVVFPKLSTKITSGVVVEWAKEVGESVEQGEVLYAVETDKAVHEIEAQCSGKLTQLNVELGQEVNVGDVLALIEVAEPVLEGEEA